MFGMKIFDFILSLCFIFFLSSLIASWIYELLSRIFKLRSWNLWKVLNGMIGDKSGKNNTDDKSERNDKDDKNVKKRDVNLLEKLYEHSLIQEHTKNGKKPEYIPDKEFGFVVLDILKKIGKEKSGGTGENGTTVGSGEEKEQKEIDITLLRAGVERIKNPLVRDKLLLFLDTVQAADKDIDKTLASLQSRFETWFNNMMKRATDLYKRYASIIMFFIGLGLAGMLNIDSLQLAGTLWYDSKLSETVSIAASRHIEDSMADKTAGEKNKMDIYRELDALKLLPVGWNTYTFPADSDFWGKLFNILIKIVGITISALAISQGGPFWYELLLKIIKLKKTLQQKEP